MKKFLPLLIVISLFLSGCDLTLAKPPSYNIDRPSLVLHLGSSDIATRTIAPTDVAMVIDHYNISGEGPDGEIFTADGVTGTTHSEDNLAAGDWSITVEAYNSSDDFIASGINSCTITEGGSTDVTITVMPRTGPGTLELNINYPTDIGDLVIDATLTPYGGAAVELTETDFTSANPAVYTDPDLAAGYYYLTIMVYDGTTKLLGRTVSVRILTDETTVGTWTAESSSTPVGGTSAITIESELYNPLLISFSGDVSPLTAGTDQSITATLSESVSGETYQWYIDGDAITGETASSITYGDELDLGNHALDLLVVYNSTLSSGSVEFTVE